MPFMSLSFVWKACHVFDFTQVWNFFTTTCERCETDTILQLRAFFINIYCEDTLGINSDFTGFIFTQGIK